MAARLVGAHPIIGVDRRPKRLELALQLGATIRSTTAVKTYRRIVHITGRGVDYVVETTASPKMHQLAIEVLNPNGVVALLTGESGTDSLPEGRKTIGIIQGDAIPSSLFLN